MQQFLEVFNPVYYRILMYPPLHVQYVCAGVFDGAKRQIILTIIMLNEG